MSSKLTKPPIGYVNIRVFAHATEDQARVIQAVKNMLTQELGEIAVFKTTNLTGHHGNPITLIQIELSNRELLTVLLRNIGERLVSLDREILKNEIIQHVEKGNLYLRFDKQHAFLKQLRFTSNDPIHVKFHFRNKTTEEIIAICQEAGLLP